jgi:mono/diheme cytochrome c family protein
MNAVKKAMIHRLLLALSAAGSAGLGASALAQAPAATAGAAVSGSDGAALFESRCALCHRGSGPGVFMLERRVGKELAILEERDNLTRPFLQAVVRNGIGSMPRFTRAEVTDAELAALADYLKAR